MLCILWADKVRTFRYVNARFFAEAALHLLRPYAFT